MTHELNSESYLQGFHSWFFNHSVQLEEERKGIYGTMWLQGRVPNDVCHRDTRIPTSTPYSIGEQKKTVESTLFLAKIVEAFLPLV